MNYRKASLVGLTLLLGLASLSFKCGGGPDSRPPSLRNAARASDDIARSLSELVQVKRDLAAKGQLTPAEELNLTSKMLRVNAADKALSNRLKSLNDVPDASTVAQIRGTFNELNAALSDLNTKGINLVQNLEGRSRLAAVARSADVSLQVLQAATNCYEIPPNCFQCGTDPAVCPRPTPTPRR